MELHKEIKIQYFSPNLKILQCLIPPLRRKKYQDTGEGGGQYVF